ncbi:MAG TPA: DUF4397 domain-containing protein [Kofleriaceae bacterium]|jgi:hypothetical protein
MKTTTLAALLSASLSLTACTSSNDGPSGTARLRIAHLSPDAPAVDACIAPAGSGEWQGPLLASNGAATGLSYGNLTKYLDVPAEQYDVRIVAPGSANCDTALGGLADITDLPVLKDGDSATISAIGRLDNKTSQPFRLTTFLDDADVTFGKAKLRVIHAAPGTAGVSVGFGGGVTYSPFIDNVQFGSTTQANNGYFEVDPISGAEITARDIVSQRDAISIKPVNLPAGAIATAFAIGTAGDATSPLDVLLCVDSAAPQGLLSDCKKVGSAPERAHIRIAHLSPDAPKVDVCLAPAGSGQWGKPLLRTLGGTGLSYSQVTTYVDLPVASYDVRVITATSTGCEAGAVPDTNGVAVTAGLYATVAATGDLDNSGAAASDPSFALKVIVDDATRDSSKLKLRFFHASPGTPAVDIGINQGIHFVRLFAGVAFGNTGSVSGSSYYSGAGVTAPVTARIANAQSDALSTAAVAFANNEIYSAFAIGGKTGQAANPLKVLLCTDTAPANGLLSSCVVAP